MNEQPTVTPGRPLHPGVRAMPSVVVACDPREPIRSWTPERYVDAGGCEVGIAWDDGCLVVLVEKLPSQWIPTSWIPPQAVRALAEMAEAYPLQCGV